MWRRDKGATEKPQDMNFASRPFHPSELMVAKATASFFFFLTWKEMRQSFMIRLNSVRDFALKNRPGFYVICFLYEKPH